MTEKTITPQRIGEFIDNLLDDVKAGRITPEGALVASQQYEYLHNTLVEHNDAITGAFSDEKEFTSAVTEMLEGALARVRRELPQFQNETPNQPLSPETIVARSKAFRVAREDSASAITRQQERVAALKNSFVDRLVNNWITQTRTSIDKEGQRLVAKEIREKLEKAPLEAMSPTEVGGFVQKTLAGFRLDRDTVTQIQQEVAPAEKEFIGETKKLTGLHSIPRALVSRSDISRPEWFTSIAIQTALSSFVAPKELISRAHTLARQAEAIAPSAQQEKGVPVTNVFFRAFASTTTQKAFAAAADALLGQLSPFARQEVIKAAFSRALEGALVKTDVLTGRLGREFVESELFRFVVDDARKEFAQGASSGGGVKQARGALDDIIGSVLRGPIPPQLVGTPKEMILSYFELLAIEARLPTNRKVLFPERSPTVNALFAAPAAPHSAQGSVVALAVQFPSWQALYVALLLGFTPSLLSSSGGQRQPSVGVARGAEPLGVVGGVFTSLGRVLSGAAVGLSGGLLSLFFGGGLGALFGGRRGPEAPVGLLDDTPKLLAIVIVVVVVVLFVFPSFLNATFINNAAKTGALFVSSQEVRAGGPYDEVFPQYGGPFPGDPTAIASCAVDRKHLTQKPFDPGGIGTHIKTCAYDFDAPQGFNVSAVHSGYIAAVRFDIPDYKKIEGSYGNYVLIAGKTEGGAPFFSRYAHLAQGSAPGLTVGSVVNAGTVIGRIDNTGNTTGPHLHLEFLDGNQNYITEDQCFSLFALPSSCTQ